MHLSRVCEKVLAVDTSGEALARLRGNADANHCTNIETIEANSDLADDVRAEIVKELREARSAALARATAESDAAAFENAFESAPIETARLRAALDEAGNAPPDLVALGVREGMALGEIEQILARESALAASAAARLNELEYALESQRERPAVIRARIADLQAVLDELSEP